MEPRAGPPPASAPPQSSDPTDESSSVLHSNARPYRLGREGTIDASTHLLPWGRATLGAAEPQPHRIACELRTLKGIGAVRYLRARRPSHGQEFDQLLTCVEMLKFRGSVCSRLMRRLGRHTNSMAGSPSRRIKTAKDATEF